jgi:hypothetical protein
MYKKLLLGLLVLAETSLAGDAESSVDFRHRTRGYTTPTLTQTDIRRAVNDALDKQNKPLDDCASNTCTVVAVSAGAYSVYYAYNAGKAVYYVGRLSGKWYKNKSTIV